MTTKASLIYRLALLAFVALGLIDDALAQKMSAALYYDAKGNLLQAEDLSQKFDYGDRLLQDIADHWVPRLTQKAVDNIVEKCTVPTEKPMIKDADFVIYWGASNWYDGLAHPRYLEYVRGVDPAARVMEKCLGFAGGGAGCPATRPRCMTGCAGAPNNCALYCCVPY
jgi:hypothetical protein